AGDPEARPAGRAAVPAEARAVAAAGPGVGDPEGDGQETVGPLRHGGGARGRPGPLAALGARAGAGPRRILPAAQEDRPPPLAGARDRGVDRVPDLDGRVRVALCSSL